MIKVNVKRKNNFIKELQEIKQNEKLENEKINLNKKIRYFKYLIYRFINVFISIIVFIILFNLLQ